MNRMRGHLGRRVVGQSTHPPKHLRPRLGNKSRLLSSRSPAAKHLAFLSSLRHYSQPTKFTGNRLDKGQARFEGSWGPGAKTRLCPCLSRLILQPHPASLLCRWCITPWYRGLLPRDGRHDLTESTGCCRLLGELNL